MNFTDRRLLSKISFIIALLWFIAQIVCIIVYWGDPQYSDAHSYQRLALLSYESGSWYPTAEQLYSELYIFNPGYINFLIGCLALFGTLNIVPVIQLFLNVALLFMLRHICSRICNRAVADYFTILFCIIYSNIIVVVPMMSELYFAFFLFLSMVLLREKPLFLFLAGFFIVYANYIRPISILFIPAVLLYCLYHKYHWKSYLFYLGGVAAMSLVLICFNYSLNGSKTIAASTGGVNLIIGAIANTTGTYDHKVFEENQLGYIENAEQYSVFEKDSIWKTRSLEWIKENPVEYIKYAPLKCVRLWWADSYMQVTLKNSHTHDIGQLTFSQKILSIIFQSLGYYVTLFFFCLALFRLRKKLWGYWGIFLIPLVAGTFLHMLMYGGMRYHYPYMPVIIFYAAVGVALLTKMVSVNDFENNSFRKIE